MMSDVKPKLGQLSCELASLTWGEVMSMAVQLGVEFPTLRQIGQDHPEQSVRILAAMDNWLSNNQEASWRKVVSALKTIKKNVLADDLEKKYCSPATTDCSVTLSRDERLSPEDVIRVLEEKLTRAEETIRDQEQQIKEMRQQEAEKEELMQAKDRELAQVQQQLRQLRQQSTPQAARPVSVPHSMPPSKQGKLTVQFHRKKIAPRRMKRGSATTDDQFAYFTPYGCNVVYSYQWSTAKWEELPESPYYDSGLVIIDGELTAVGGSRTNELFTLRKGQWVEYYPPMNIKCSSPAVVSTSDGDYIVVIGGSTGGDWTTTVDVFHVRTRIWHELVYLPPSLPQPSATICDNKLHLIGRDGTGYSCSLQALLSSDQPLNIIKWTPLPQAPVEESTAATLCGQLVIIGELKQEDTVYVMQDIPPVNPIHQLVNGQWVKIGSMSDGRNMCLVVSPSPDKMMIVGGLEGRYNTNRVEECIAV